MKITRQHRRKMAALRMAQTAVDSLKYKVQKGEPSGLRTAQLMYDLDDSDVKKILEELDKISLYLNSRRIQNGHLIYMEGKEGS